MELISTMETEQIFVVQHGSEVYHTFQAGCYGLAECERYVHDVHIRIHGKGAEAWLKGAGYRPCKQCEAAIAKREKMEADDGANRS